jgi:OOP family OmpA-OmpF porin
MMVATVNNTAEAQGQKGFYIGAGVGSAANDVSTASFGQGLADAGYTVTDVVIDDGGTGFKVYAGYMFNQYIGAQGSYVDLGDIDSSFTASVPPDQIDDLLDTAAALLPGRGKGFLADLVLQYPFSDRFAVYGTAGVFFAEPETTQTVVSGGEGTKSRSDDDTDFAGSIGIKISFLESSSIKIGYERYSIDGDTIDFPMAAFTYSFGGN